MGEPTAAFRQRRAAQGVSMIFDGFPVDGFGHGRWFMPTLTAARSSRGLRLLLISGNGAMPPPPAMLPGGATYHWLTF